MCLTVTLLKLSTHLYIDVTNTPAVVLERVLGEYATNPDIRVFFFEHDILAVELLDRLYRHEDEYIKPMSKEKIVHLSASYDILYKHQKVPTQYQFPRYSKKTNTVIFVGNEPSPYMSYYVMANGVVPKVFIGYNWKGECQTYDQYLSAVASLSTPEMSVQDMAVTYLAWHLVSGDSNYLPPYAKTPKALVFSSDSVDSVLEKITSAYPVCEIKRDEQLYKLELMSPEVIEAEKTYSYQTMMMYLLRMFMSCTSSSRAIITSELPWWYGYYSAPLSMATVIKQSELSGDRLCNDFRSYGNLYAMQTHKVENFLRCTHTCQPTVRARNYLVLSFPRIIGAHGSPIVSVGKGRPNIYHLTNPKEYMEVALKQGTERIKNEAMEREAIEARLAAL